MPGEFGNPSRSPAFRADIWSVIVRYLHVILGSDDMSDMFIGQQLARHDTTGCDQSIPMRCLPAPTPTRATVPYSAPLELIRAPPVPARAVLARLVRSLRLARRHLRNVRPALPVLHQIPRNQRAQPPRQLFTGKSAPSSRVSRVSHCAPSFPVDGA